MRYAEINKDIIEEGPIWDKTKRAAKAAAVVGALGAATIGAADAHPGRTRASDNTHVDRSTGIRHGHGNQSGITWTSPGVQQDQSGIIWKDPGVSKASHAQHHPVIPSPGTAPTQPKQETKPIKPSKCMMSVDGKTIDCYMSDGGKTSIKAVDRDGKRLSKRDIQQRLKAAYSLYVMKKNNYTIREPNYETPEPKTKTAPEITPKKAKLSTIRI